MTELRTDKYGLFKIKSGQTKRYNLGKVEYNKLRTSYYWHKYNNGLQAKWEKVGNFVEITGL